MDWYYENNIDDYIVPKDQGLSDRILSPDSWSQWGISDPESYQDLDKCFAFDPKSTREESSYNGSRSICDELGIEDSVHDKYQSSCSSIYGGSSNDTFRQNTVSCNQHDYQLEGLAGFEQMDDIFLYSVTSGIKKLNLLAVGNHKFFLKCPLKYDDHICNIRKSNGNLTDSLLFLFCPDSSWGWGAINEMS